MITHLAPTWMIHIPLCSIKKAMPLAEAISTLIRSDNVITLGSMIRYNIPLRDAYRDMGAETFTKELVEISHNHEDITCFMQWFNKRMAKEQGLAEYDIQVYNKNIPLTFFRVTIQGLQEIKRCVECTLNAKHGTPYSINPNISDIHIGKVWERYPTFDIYDCGDKRTFDNYLICDHAITKEELLVVADILGPINGNRITEDIPTDCLPLVYCEGSGDEIYVATKKE